MRAVSGSVWSAGVGAYASGAEAYGVSVAGYRRAGGGVKV